MWRAGIRFCIVGVEQEYLSVNSFVLPDVPILNEVGFIFQQFFVPG